MNITYKKLTVNDLDVFIKMRINQLRELWITTESLAQAECLS